jgi:hypothetical protein
MPYLVLWLSNICLSHWHMKALPSQLPHGMCANEQRWQRHTGHLPSQLRKLRSSVMHSTVVSGGMLFACQDLAPCRR